jgi:hypothetical protein
MKYGQKRKDKMANALPEQNQILQNKTALKKLWEHQKLSLLICFFQKAY